MKNFVAPGNTISVTSPTNATSGDLVLFGAFGRAIALINREITGKDLLQSLDLTFGT
jgi:predicted RecA/RadA family phage recombinase